MNGLRLKNIIYIIKSLIFQSELQQQRDIPSFLYVWIMVVRVVVGFVFQV